MISANTMRLKFINSFYFRSLNSQTVNRETDAIDRGWTRRKWGLIKTNSAHLATRGHFTSADGKIDGGGMLTR